MLKVSNNPVVDTVTKLVTVAIGMFAFVFVVMVPLYDVLCDALGINGKTAGSAYTAVAAEVDESRTITVQFVATNNEGMPWDFGPSVTAMIPANRHPMPTAINAHERGMTSCRPRPSC